MVRAGGAMVSDEGQPLYTVAGNPVQWNLSEKLFAGMYQDPLKKKKNS